MKPYFSDTCPIFKEGVESELMIPVRLSGSISVDQAQWTFGREVTVIEAYVRTITGSLGSADYSCSIGFFKGTLSTRIGSIAMTSAKTKVSDDCMPVMIEGSVTSTSFTSTDVLCVAMDAAIETSVAVAIPAEVHIRFRDR